MTETQEEYKTEPRAEPEGPTFTATLSAPGERWDGWQVVLRIPEEWGDVEDLNGTGSLDVWADAVLRHVYSWSFTDKQGKPLPVTRAGLRHVPPTAMRAVCVEAVRATLSLPNRSGDD